jgi:NADH pyrophosphatase NudC (nudix superfamily)
MLGLLGMDDETAKLLREVKELLQAVFAELEEYRPMLEKYKAVSQAGSFLKARKEMKRSQ